MAVTRYRALAWARFVPADCACAEHAPCLLHCDDFDRRTQAQVRAQVGISYAPGGGCA
jgi:hypothetical protein